MIRCAHWWIGREFPTGRTCCFWGTSGISSVYPLIWCAFFQDGRKCCSSPNGRDFLVVNSQGRAPQKSRHGSSWINIVTTMFQLEGMATFSFYSSATKERFWQRRENAFQLEMRARFYWAEIWISLRGNFITFGNQNEIWLTHLQIVLSFGNNEN